MLVQPFTDKLKATDGIKSLKWPKAQKLKSWYTKTFTNLYNIYNSFEQKFILINFHRIKGVVMHH